jgi:transposase-like protein
VIFGIWKQVGVAFDDPDGVVEFDSITNRWIAHYDCGTVFEAFTTWLEAIEWLEKALNQPTQPTVT